MHRTNERPTSERRYNGPTERPNAPSGEISIIKRRLNLFIRTDGGGMFSRMVSQRFPTLYQCHKFGVREVFALVVYLKFIGVFSELTQSKTQDSSEFSERR